MPPPDDRWTVIYDADCGFCRAMLALFLGADRDRRLRPLALDTPEADRLLADLTDEQRRASWHLVDPAGHRTSAGAAAPPLLRLLPGGAPIAQALDRAPNATGAAYAWVAANRTSLSRFVPNAAKRRATGRIAERSRPRPSQTASDLPE